MPTIPRRRALAYAGVLVFVLGGGGTLLARGSDAGGGTAAETIAPLVADSGATETVPSDVVVHVAGAVRRPGLYRLAAGSRIDDAIRAAGGPQRRAALDLVNLAAPVVDGQQVAVPLRAVVGSASSTGALAPPAAPAPVSLSAATFEQLDALPGVGPVTAQKILDYRAENGAFQTVEELDAVSGIGPARLEELRELVTP